MDVVGNRGVKLQHARFAAQEDCGGEVVFPLPDQVAQTRVAFAEGDDLFRPVEHEIRLPAVLAVSGRNPGGGAERHGQRTGKRRSRDFIVEPDGPGLRAAPGQPGELQRLAFAGSERDSRLARSDGNTVLRHKPQLELRPPRQRIRHRRRQPERLLRNRRARGEGERRLPQFGAGGFDQADDHRLGGDPGQHGAVRKRERRRIAHHIDAFRSGSIGRNGDDSTRPVRLVPDRQQPVAAVLEDEAVTPLRQLKLPDVFRAAEVPGQHMIDTEHRLGLEIGGQQPEMVFRVVRRIAVVPQVVPVVADRAAAP